MINKNITEAEIEATVDRVFMAGWRLIKLYFMIGLPTETDQDIQAIVELVKKIERRLSGRGRGGLNVAVSTFIPETPHPVPVGGHDGLAEIRRRQEMIRGSLRSPRIALKFHDPRMSMLESVFSRGDRRLCAVIIRAARLGCRFDGWSDHFRSDLWEEAFREAGLTIEQYAQRTLPVNGPLPWEHIETGVTGRFLADERGRAYAAAATVGCVTDRCADCGVCESGSPKIHAADRQPAIETAVPADEAVSGETNNRLKYLFFYSRTGLVRFLSHLELASVIERTLARAGVPVNFTEGYHPKPRISFAGALPVGVEARREPLWSNSPETSTRMPSPGTSMRCCLRGFGSKLSSPRRIGRTQSRWGLPSGGGGSSSRTMDTDPMK